MDSDTKLINILLGYENGNLLAKAEQDKFFLVRLFEFVKIPKSPQRIKIKAAESLQKKIK